MEILRKSETVYKERHQAQNTYPTKHVHTLQTVNTVSNLEHADNCTSQNQKARSLQSTNRLTGNSGFQKRLLMGGKNKRVRPCCHYVRVSQALV